MAKGKGKGRFGLMGVGMEEMGGALQSMICCFCCMLILGPIFIVIGLGSLGDAAGTDERAEQIKIFNKDSQAWMNTYYKDWKNVKFTTKVGGSNSTGKLEASDDANNHGLMMADLKDPSYANNEAYKYVEPTSLVYVTPSSKGAVTGKSFTFTSGGYSNSYNVPACLDVNLTKGSTSTKGGLTSDTSLSSCALNDQQYDDCVQRAKQNDCSHNSRNNNNNNNNNDCNDNNSAKQDCYRCSSRCTNTLKGRWSASNNVCTVSRTIKSLQVIVSTSGTKVTKPSLSGRKCTKTAALVVWSSTNSCSGSGSNVAVLVRHDKDPYLLGEESSNKCSHDYGLSAAQKAAMGGIFLILGIIMLAIPLLLAYFIYSMLQSRKSNKGDGNATQTSNPTATATVVTAQAVTVQAVPTVTVVKAN